MNKVEKQFKEACKSAGLIVNGNRPQAPQILDSKKFCHLFAKNPFLAMGEAFVAKYIDVKNLDEMIKGFAQAQMNGSLPKFFLSQKLSIITYNFRKKIGNPQKKKQFEIADLHYDIGNDLMTEMTGKWQKYTSGYWPATAGKFDLDTSQELDLKIICERLGLKKGMKILDIGFGYGRNSRYMVENYGVHVTGITISKEQKKLAEEHCKDISEMTTFILSDWAKITPNKLGKFDRVIILEMIENIGHKNYNNFFKFVYRCLNKEGSVLIQAINRPIKTHATNPFIDKYIFPNGVTPGISEVISEAINSGLNLRLVDNSLGAAYDHTLVSWWKNSENFLNSNNHKYKDYFKNIFPFKTKDDTFKRIWQFYLLSCAGAYRAGLIQDGHFIFEKNSLNVNKQDINIPKTRSEINNFLKNT